MPDNFKFPESWSLNVAAVNTPTGTPAPEGDVDGEGNCVGDVEPVSEDVGDEEGLTVLEREGLLDEVNEPVMVGEMD